MERQKDLLSRLDDCLFVFAQGAGYETVFWCPAFPLKTREEFRSFITNHFNHTSLESLELWIFQPPSLIFYTKTLFVLCL